MTFGLISTGFNAKRLADIQAELDTAFRASFGAGIKTTPDTQFGKLIGILADRETAIWELAEAVYNSQYPGTASNTSLDRLGEITAISRNSATPSTVIVYLAGINTTVVPAGSLMAVQDAGDQFQLTVDVTLSGSNFSITSLTRVGSIVTANATAHGRSIGQRVFINDANEVEYNGLQLIDTVADPNTFTYTIAGTPATPATGVITGDPTTSGSAQSVNNGPIAALAGTLNQIVNSVSGWARVENALDAVKGINQETDAEYRLRRLAALQGLGAARLEAIRGSLLTLSNVSDAKVFENATGLVDVSGRPPHSIEALVVGGADQDILDTVWQRKAAGIELFGNTSGTVIDSQGTNHTSRFSRATIVNIFLEIDLTVDASFPGVLEVESRVINFGDALGLDQDVIVFPYLVASFDDVPGILDIVIRIGTAASPTLDDNIVIGETQIADFDSTRTTVITV